METPSHIAHLTAYLYSWLKSALPIDSVINLPNCLDSSSHLILSFNWVSVTLSRLTSPHSTSMHFKPPQTAISLIYLILCFTRMALNVIVIKISYNIFPSSFLSCKPQHLPFYSFSALNIPPRLTRSYYTSSSKCHLTSSYSCSISISSPFSSSCQYDGEFILHGAVGYLTHFYVEHIYGEEDAKFRWHQSIHASWISSVHSTEVDVRTLPYAALPFSVQL